MWSGRSGNTFKKTYKWNKPALFTWLRLEFDSKVSYNDLTLTLNGKLCQNTRLFSVDDKTLDVACDDHVLMTILEIGGLKHLINSLHLSGGRNFALFQTSYQSSTMNAYGSQFAVDGIVLNYCQNVGCSHTDLLHTSPTWTVFFDQQYNINKCVLYSVHEETKKLNGFVLEMLGINNATLYRYQDDSNSSEYYYPVLIKEGGYFAARVSRQQTISQQSAAFLVLNEFEAYGDCVPGFWGLTCREKCPTSCSLSCHPEHGKCNEICVGYTDPPNCSIECDRTHFGLHCKTNCSSQCSQTGCDSKTGRCKAIKVTFAKCVSIKSYLFKRHF
uniref:Uncharacterized protein n=1 Tax=Biomphalaria glabrata TaxID=6526 RepID=A0A2C9L373_BIOGL